MAMIPGESKEIFLGLVYLQNREFRRGAMMIYFALPILIGLFFVVKPSMLSFMFLSTPMLLAVLRGIFTAFFIYQSFPKYSKIYAEGGQSYFDTYGEEIIAESSKAYKFWFKDSIRVYWRTNLWRFSIVKFLIIVSSSFVSWHTLYRIDAIRYQYLTGIVLILMAYVAFGLSDWSALYFWKVGIAPSIKKKYGFDYKDLCIGWKGGLWGN
jgi:hypothetical protein